MEPAERMEILIKNLNTNVKTVSDLCGYERPQAFYDILKGKTKNISHTVCDKIVAAFPQVNRIWLLTGVGEMFAKPKEENTIDDAEEVPTGAYVPLVPLTAFAGPIKTYCEDGIDLSQCQKIYSADKDVDLAIFITGDSMEPLFMSGSIAFIKRINESAFIPWGHPLVLDTENGVFIKNVLPDESETNFFWAESVNTKYPRMHIPKSSVFGMYRVVNVQRPCLTY